MKLEQFYLHTNVNDKSLLWKRGIYKITNTISGRVYIGQTTTHFLRRWCEHQDTLEQNKHHNRHLQRAFNKYGKDAFIFEIVEIIETEQANVYCEREAYYINMFSHNLYNSKMPPNNTGLLQHLKQGSSEKAKQSAKIASNRPERKKQFIATMKEYWKLHSNEQSLRVKQYYSLQENRQKTSDAIKKKYKDYVYKHRVAEATRKSHQTEEFRTKLSVIQKKRFANSTERARTSEATKQYFKTKHEYVNVILYYFIQTCSCIKDLSINNKCKLINLIALSLSSSQPINEHELQSMFSNSYKDIRQSLAQANVCLHK